MFSEIYQVVDPNSPFFFFYNFMYVSLFDNEINPQSNEGTSTKLIGRPFITNVFLIYLFAKAISQALQTTFFFNGTQMFDLKFHICDISILLFSFFPNEIMRKQNLLVPQRFGCDSKTFPLK